MNQPITQLQKKISDHDHADALRMVDSTVSLVAMAALASPAARDLAIVRIRGLMSNHPYASEMLSSVVSYLESHQGVATADPLASGA